MKANAWQDTSRANWIDYLLCWLSSVFAVFSCGMAVNSFLVAGLGIAAVTVGLGISYLVRVKFGQRIYPWVDGTLYAIFAWLAVIGARTINMAIFPEDTFPIELTPSAWLLWMTIFGSFFCWRDGTIIFQAIPALAIFGFVGCYDTFRYVVFFFFAFLLCFATLFARAHGRDMQERAVQSGYFQLGQSHHLEPGEQSTVLREGPWRWAAGAEWALGSALIIVVLSLIGAPVIQASAKPLSGIVSVRAPRLRNSSQAATSLMVPDRAGVGGGPVSLSDTPFYDVSGDVPQYLQFAHFANWTGKDWTTTDEQKKELYRRIDNKMLGPESADESDRIRYPNKKKGQYWDEYRSQLMNVKALVVTKEILQAGNYPVFNCDRPQVPNAPNMSLVTAEKYEGTLNYDPIPDLKRDSKAPDVIDSWLEPYMKVLQPIARMKQLADDTVKGIDSDPQKALALQEAIRKRIKYNIKADATPEGKDAADYALFDSNQGYCDVFATSMVLLARYEKIPARYCVGYQPDSKNRNAEGTQTILESDRHAWAELYFDKVGWVVFDATMGAEVVPGGGRNDNKPRDTAAMVRLIGKILNGLIVVSVIVGVAVYIRIRRLPKTAEMIRGELDLEYIKFIGAIWRVSGNRRLLSETTNEYLHRSGAALGPLQEEATEIGTKFTNIMFGPAQVSGEDVESIRQSVQHFRDELARLQKVKPNRRLETVAVPQES